VFAVPKKGLTFAALKNSAIFGGSCDLLAHYESTIVISRSPNTHGAKALPLQGASSIKIYSTRVRRQWSWIIFCGRVHK